MKIHINHFMKFIGIILYVYILSQQNWNEVFKVFAQSNIFLIIFSLFLFFFIILFKCYRIKLFIKNDKLSISKIFSIYTASFFWGIITPGRLGEFSRILYFLPYIKSKIMTVIIIIIDRVSDLTFLLFWSLIGIIYLLHNKIVIFQEFNFYLIIVISLLIIVFLAMLFRHNILKFIIKIIKKFDIKNVSEKDFLNFVNTKKIILVIIKTCLSWFFYFLQIYLISISLKLPFNLIELSFITSIASVVGLIPITISGIGTRDATIIYLFKIYGLQQEKAFSFSLFFLLIIFFHAMISLPFWLYVKDKEN